MGRTRTRRRNHLCSVGFLAGRRKRRRIRAGVHPLGLWRVNIQVVDRKSRVDLVGISPMGAGMGRLGMGQFLLRRLRQFSSRCSIMRVLNLLHKIKWLLPRHLSRVPPFLKSRRSQSAASEGPAAAGALSAVSQLFPFFASQSSALVWSTIHLCSHVIHLIHILFRVCSWTTYFSTTSWFPHTHRIFNGRPWARCTRAQRHMRLCG